MRRLTQVVLILRTTVLASLSVPAVVIAGRRANLAIGSAGRPGRRGVRLRSACALVVAVFLAVLGVVPMTPASAAEPACHGWKVNRTLREVIQAPGSERCVTFPATAGDRFRIVVASTTQGTALISRLVGPDGGAVPCDERRPGVLVCTVGATGAQVLSVRAAGPTLSAVTFKVTPWSVSNPASCRTVAYGQQIAPNRATCVAFSGKAWERIAISTVSSKRVDVEVLDPTLNSACERATQSWGTYYCTLSATGRHVILLEPIPDLNGYEYSAKLTLVSAPENCKAVSANGAPQPIGVATSACMRFSGTAGQTFRFRIASDSGLDQGIRSGARYNSPDSLEIFGPDGTVECPRVKLTDSTCTMTTTGTHTVRLFDSSQPYANSNSLAIRRTSPRLNCPPFRVGTAPVVGAIDRAVELDCYAVDARAGETLWIRFANVGTRGVPSAEVLGPDGATVCVVDADSVRSCRAPSAGTYSVIVGNATTVKDSYGSPLSYSDYALSIQRPVARPTGCVALEAGGPPLEVATTQPAEAACLQFWGEPGDVVRVRSTGSLTTEFLDANGANCVALSWATCVVTTTGNHTLLLGGPAAGVGTETLTMQRLNRPKHCTQLTPGAAPVGATLGHPVEMDCFTVQAVADRFISVQVTQQVTPTEPVTYELIGPDGRVICGPTTNVSLSCDAPTAGRYVVLVGGRGGALGKYQVRVRLAEPPAG